MGALLVMFRYKVGVIPVIVTCGLVGVSFLFIKPWMIQYGVY
jgi:chromate transporter